VAEQTVPSGDEEEHQDIVGLLVLVELTQVLESGERRRATISQLHEAASGEARTRTGYLPTPIKEAATLMKQDASGPSLVPNTATTRDGQRRLCPSTDCKHLALV